MEERNLTRELVHFGIFIILAAVIFVSGWNEPLRYLFMKPNEVMTEESALFPKEPPQQRSPYGWSPGGTSLDRSPYRTNNDGLEYTNNFDSRSMGTRSETDRRSGTQGKSR